jgi:hypothetical protein
MPFDSGNSINPIELINTYEDLTPKKYAEHPLTEFSTKLE